MSAMRTIFRMMTLLSISIFFSAALMYAQENEEVPADLTIDMVLEDFDAAWKALSEEYVDEGFGGLDWDDIKKEYRARVEEAEDAGSAYVVLAEMISRLQNPGTVVVPPWLRSPRQEPDDSEPELEYGGIGVLLQVLSNGEVMVLQVFKNTPAERAGVLVGDVVVGVNDWRVEGENPVSAIAERVRGVVGTSVDITFKDPDGEERKLPIERATIDLRPSVESRKVGGNYGYLRVPVLSQGLVQEASKALPRLLSTSGLILDLRSVSGGDMQSMSTVARWFLGAGHLGGIVSRGEQEPLQTIANAIAAYQRPLIVLTNPGTYGIGEILAGLLSEYGRATLIGNQTAGGFDMGKVVELPSGGALRMTIGLYITPKGQILPPIGIEPDVLVDPPDLESIRSGTDVYIDAAVEELRNPKRR